MSSDIKKYSDPSKVFKLAKQYLGPDVNIKLSTNPKKKYMVQDPTGKWIHFGAIPYEDYTKHKDDERRQRYLNRATNIKGSWKENKYSPNNLAIHLLW